ncbi:MAG: MarR family transcriptional regulator [Gemmatimonadaceae bacterium]|nr:MarR family transcriptional regulator [Gemmatimonadaceae bacterium]
MIAPLDDSAPPPAAEPKRSKAEKDSAAALRAWVVLARAYLAISRHVTADVARHELTASEFGILEALYHKGPLLLGDLQKKILVTSGGVTYLVNRLAAKGLVTRESFPGDKRSRFAVLTPEGSALIRQIFPGHAKRLAKVMGALSAKEQKRLTGMLRTLGKGAEREPTPRERPKEKTRLSQ